MIKKRKTAIEVAVDQRLRYKKISGGIHIHSDGQKVKKGEILYAYPEDLSKTTLAHFTCLDEKLKEPDDISMHLGLRDRGNGWYDVINKKTGQVLNDQAMRAKDARQFITGDFEDAIVKDDVVEDGTENETEDEEE